MESHKIGVPKISSQMGMPQSGSRMGLPRFAPTLGYPKLSPRWGCLDWLPDGVHQLSTQDCHIWVRELKIGTQKEFPTIVPSDPLLFCDQ